MSRRFGRNQRRRAREAQAQLIVDLNRTSDALALTTRLSIERGRRVTDLQEEIARAKALLPRRSVLDRPEAMHVGNEPRGRVYATPDEEEACVVSAADAAMESRTFERVALDVLLTDVSFNDLNRKLHARVQFDGADVFYAISPEAVAAMPRRDLADRLAKEIARQLTPALMRELESGRRR